jgi:hypothetical protein
VSHPCCLPLLLLLLALLPMVAVLQEVRVSVVGQNLQVGQMVQVQVGTRVPGCQVWDLEVP